jgi:hypothetical protein
VVRGAMEVWQLSKQPGVNDPGASCWRGKAGWWRHWRESHVVYVARKLVVGGLAMELPSL